MPKLKTNRAAAKRSGKRPTGSASSVTAPSHPQKKTSSVSASCAGRPWSRNRTWAGSNSSAARLRGDTWHESNVRHRRTPSQKVLGKAKVTTTRAARCTHCETGGHQGGQYAYRDRRAKKRDMRRSGSRINAGARVHGLSYSRLIAGLR